MRPSPSYSVSFNDQNFLTHTRCWCSPACLHTQWSDKRNCEKFSFNFIRVQRCSGLGAETRCIYNTAHTHSQVGAVKRTENMKKWKLLNRKKGGKMWSFFIRLRLGWVWIFFFIFSTDVTSPTTIMNCTILLQKFPRFFCWLLRARSVCMFFFSLQTFCTNESKREKKFIKK